MDIVFQIILILYLGVKIFSCWLEFLNFKHLKRYSTTIPPEFRQLIDSEKMEKINNYTVEKIRIGIYNTVYSSIIMISFVFCGIIEWYNDFLIGFNLSYYVTAILFYLLIVIAYSFLEIPFDLYKTFKLEKKYGFNTMTFKLWLVDFLKTVIISSAIITGLVFAVLYTITNFVHTWWLWSWLIFFVFTMFMMYISPYILEPLFNKFNPVEDEELIVKLKNLMSSVGIKINKVLKIDASKRTMHTNAYFSGIGNVKRIVLFDTLMEKMDNDEIVSVIAHEAGHWKKKHVIKNIIVLEIITFIFFFAAYCLIKTDLLMSIFDIGTLSSVPDVYYCSVKLFLIYFLFGIVLFPLTPVMHYFSRKHEYEADRFAVDLLNDSSSLKSALIKLSTDNLSNLYPHPIYEAFNYSHPSILKRLGYLADLGKDTNEVKHKNN